MALIDMLTDISSFDYSKVGEKQGEYFGEDKATGFTPNRQTKNPTEYVENQITGLGTTDYFTPNYNPLEEQIGTSIHLTGTTPPFPGPVDYFKPDFNPFEGHIYPISGNTNLNYFTPDNPLEDLTSIYLDINNLVGDTLQYSKVGWFKPDYNPLIDQNETSIHLTNTVPAFPGPVNYFTDTHATGYTLNRTEKDLDIGLGIGGGITAGEYNIGTSLYDQLGRTSFIDNDMNFTSGPFVKNMKTTDYGGLLPNEEIGTLGDFHTSLLTIEYKRLISARSGEATNKPKTSDFGSNHPYGVDGAPGQYHSELRLSDYKGQWKKFGGNKGLRESSRLFEEPFIVKEIGDRYDTIGWGMVDGLTDIPFMAVRATEDLIRFTKWTLTPKGIVWNLKQALLQSQNARKETRVYNPLGTLGSVPPLIHLPRHSDGTLLDVVEPPTYPDKTKIGGIFGLGSTGDDLGPVGDQTSMGNAGADKPAIETTTGGFLGFGGTTELSKKEVDASGGNPEFNLGSGKVKVGIGDKLYMVGVSNELQVPYGGKLESNDTTGLPKDFIKFRIRDVINGKWLVFPAHLGTITDTVTPNWTPEKYIGRPDSVHLYGGADRSVSFDFKVAAFTKQEIPIIQEKMNYLMGLGYPTFKSVMAGDDESRPVAPYIALTIGDLFNNTPGYFSSIAITIEENSTWELDENFQIPQVFSVSVEFVHVGKYLPQTIGKHYEVPWLSDYGSEDNFIKGTFVGDVADTSRPAQYKSKFDGFKDQIDEKQNFEDYWT